MEIQESQFITNTASHCFYNTLQENLQQCTQFKISVAFITFGGLQVLLDTLKELEEKNIPGEILTTTYQNMTTPSVLKRLAQFKNIKLKIYVPPTKGDGFHVKGYLFRKVYSQNGQWTIIIGSSNITGRALKTNIEWNVLQNEREGERQEPGTFSKSVLEEFNSLWKSPWAKEYSDNFLISYRDYLANVKTVIKSIPKADVFSFNEVQVINPNAMQQEAIVKLKKLRESGENKALVIAATGSGKTYMTVFDALQVKPNHLLFVVHREDILIKAKQSFDNICGLTDKDYSSGVFTGTSKNFDCKYLFATRDSLVNHYTKFAPDLFDYIVIDEAHHASSPRYVNIINYFKPQFLLGLTATPERSDSGDIYSIFDNNIAVEIRLRQALEYNLICPFHYFGLKDVEGIDYSKITAEIGTGEYLSQIASMLMVSRRVDYIIEKMNFYGHDGEKVKALGFCATIEHTEYMADEFNKRLAIDGNNIAVALSGKNKVPEREMYAKQLEDDNDSLQVIFTVDIFNEGIDIPSTNTILLLRPTESSIIFIQQLGRGLRKLDNKEFVTVLDFIGNYKKSFLMAVALNGKQDIDRDSLKVEVQTDFADLPNGTYIHMDKITKQQILAQLENEKFMSIKYMRDSYFSFKRICGGNIPLLTDYLKHDGSIDPIRFIQFSPQFKSYIEFVANVESETHPEFLLALQNPLFKTFIRFLSFYSPAKRIDEWIVIRSLLCSNNFSSSLIDLDISIQHYVENHDIEVTKHACEVLCGKYFDKSEHSKYKDVLLQFDGGNISFGKNIKDLLANKNISSFAFTWVEDLVKYNILRYQGEFGRQNYGFPFLRLYNKYTMRDTALLCNYKKIHSSFRGQGLITAAKPDYFLFVNLHKNADVKDSINYKDKFITSDVFQWQSPNTTSQFSEIGQNLIYNLKRKINLHLFVRKFEQVENITQPFIYLGKVITVKDSAIDNKPITMNFHLINRVPDNLYLDFITRTDNM